MRSLANFAVRFLIYSKLKGFTAKDAKHGRKVRKAQPSESIRLRYQEVRSMAQDEPVKSKIQTRLVIRNIGLLLSGDLEQPILDADTVVAVDGKITAVGKQKDVDIEGATLIIDAKGTTLAPGLIDSHVHPVAGDWTPRQNQIGWIDSYLHGGVTTMISAGEVHTPGRPKDVVG